MMKKYKNIDSLFRENVQGTKINPDFMTFDNIISEIEKRQKRSYVKYAILAALLLISTCLIWFIFANIFDKNHFTKTQIRNTSSESMSEKSRTQKLGSNEMSIKKIVEVSKDKELETSSKKPTCFDVSNSVSNFNNNSTYGNNIIIEQKTDDHNSTIINKDIDKNIEIKMLAPRLGLLIADLSSNNIPDTENKTLTIEEYLEKKNNFHIYTGLSFSFARMYYSSGPDRNSWSADLNLGYKIKDFYIETGVGYEHQSQFGEYKIDYETNDSIGYYNKVVSFELNPNNPEEIYYNTQKTTVYDSVNHFVLQSPLYKYNYINIPITVGYKFFNKKKITLSVETGVIFSILTNTQSPPILLTNNEAIIKEINNYTPERRDNNLRLRLSLRANYRFTKSISVNVQPEFISYLNNIYLNNSGINEKPYSMGIRAGIFFNF